MKLLVGIPAFNESQTIGGVLRSIPKRIAGASRVDVVVLDDGSKDSTVQIASCRKVQVIRHILNRGLGGALKTIFAYARLYGYDMLVTIDADGQHEGKDIRNLINPILGNKADVVVGSRWKGQRKSHLIRRLVNQAANVLTYLLFGVWCTDTQSGFRAFGLKAIRSIVLSSDGMEVSSEFFKEIYRNKLRLSEVSIRPIYTPYSKNKGQRLSNSPFVFFQLVSRFLR